MVDYRLSPAKQAYVLAQALATLFVRLPTWIAVSLLPSMRPNPNWSFGRALRVRAQNRLVVVDLVTQGLDGHPTYRAISPAHADRAVWLEPVPELVVGEVAALAQAAAVDAVRVPAYWLHRPGADLAYGAPPAPGEIVLLAFHGGAYVVRSAVPEDASIGFAHGLLAHAPGAVRRALCPEYRLSTSIPGRPPNPFPAALLDALAAYAYLVNELGVRPADIVLAGSSAGANLALALTRHLAENPGTLGLPGGLILLSPWADIGTSHNAPPPPPYLRRTDWLGNDPSGAYPAAVFAGPHGPALLDTNAYVSPASTRLPARPSFKGWPRTFMVCGSAECFTPGIRTLRDRMAADMGEDKGEGAGPGALYFYEEADAVHDFVSLPWHEPERTHALKRIAGWIAP